jgi:hypothetical protein
VSIYVTPSRDLHVPGSTLTGNDLPNKELPRAFHPPPNRKARMQGEELYLELAELPTRRAAPNELIKFTRALGTVPAPGLRRLQ